jgi:GcrA cell cycle regulator
MSWTDERVEQLRKLWLDGKSASQIAGELANGITRNAVIGKVHRLGLSGRVKSAGQPAPRPRPAPKPQSTSNASGSGGGSSHGSSHGASLSAGAMQRGQAAQRQSMPMTRGATALAYSPMAEVETVLRPTEEVVIPMSERVTIMELKESMCRWPLGDPASPEFRYCGARSPIGDTYCAHHARVAYQPSQDRRRDRDRRAQQLTRMS